jgi:hypothetical protein
MKVLTQTDTIVANATLIRCNDNEYGGDVASQFNLAIQHGIFYPTRTLARNAINMDTVILTSNKLNDGMCLVGKINKDLSSPERGIIATNVRFEVVDLSDITWPQSSTRYGHLEH